MTKIDQINPGQAPQAPAKSGSAGKTGSGDFARLLDQALTPEQSGSAAGADAPAGPAPVAGPAAPAPGLSEAQAMGVRGAERVLELLQRYADGLGEGASLKDLEPLVAELEGETSDLAGLRSGLAGDDDLAGRLDEVLSLAQAESIKFRRGDYNPA